MPQRGRNRRRRATAQAPGIVTVTGLARASEPKGAFLRSNDPAAGRWYSRDVAAIAQAHGGDLIYEDSDPHGARFKLVVPAKRPQ